ncbi:MAG: 4-hydroxy-tetrahydrodipicolinate reductase [Bacteroidetes bacterium]|nr:4-hydroxy-tetrahydrodipicolinate reductase [Bacteroidota bacterium]
MKIALIGYGKMGQAIEQIALSRGHEIGLKIRSSNQDDLNEISLQNIDVAIEFTNPESALNNILKCLRAGIPTICGTTGWNHGLAQAKMTAIENKTAFLQASNFSIGVNLFFEVNKFLATLMNDQSEYNIVIEETHHSQKKDAPSGTAITLAEQILENISRKKHWTKDINSKQEELSIIAHRKEDVPGTHHVRYFSPIDDIEIIHTAHNRSGFAKGAVLAAEFVEGKVGIFTMKDVLGIDRF